MSATKKSVSFADELEGGGEGARTLKRTAVSITDDNEDEIFGMKEPKRARQDAADAEKEEDGEKKSKHTLDSDEEEEDKYEKMDVKRIDGQEDPTIEYDGNTKITAFNMNEDMEDGHFDASGNFIFNKKEKEIKDAWLDDIDWTKVKEKAGKDWQGEQEEDGDSDDVPSLLSDVRRREIFTKLLQLLKPGQTITKSMADLKKNRGITAAEERKARWAAKKAGKEYILCDNSKLMSELSDLADELLSAGHMDCYEWPREKLELLLGKLSSAVDEVDIFSDAPPSTSIATPATPSAGAESADLTEEIMWEYKEDANAEEVKGPYTSEQMAAKQASDELGPKAVVRKVGTGSFNPAARVDFDLYV